MLKRLTMLSAGLFLMTGVALAQSSVTGTVVDENGEPVVGAAVRVEGTKTGTVTDTDGKFSINAPANSRLNITYLGMAPKSVKGGTNLKVVMVSDNKNLDEVVVTALGIKRSAKSIGYSATQVDGAEIAESRSADIMSSLAGKIAGVQISGTSGDPGSSNSVIIRGYSSISGNNQPLYVIDGVPLTNSAVYSSDGLNSGYDFGNGANAINPDDVASMTVLKGAAATALYGSRAANGVILITTKSGSKKGKGIGVTYNGGLQWENVLRLPQMQNEFGMGWYGNKTDTENGSWGPKFDGSTLKYGTVYNNTQLIKSYLPIEDNLKDFYDTGFRFSNSVSFDGATDVSTYFVSLSQIRDNGIIPTSADAYNKYTFSARASHKVKSVTLSTSLNYAYQKNNFVTTGQKLNNVSNSLTQTPRDISIAELKDLTNIFNTPGYYYTPYGVTNPYYIIDNFENENESERFYGKFQLDWDFLKYFRLTNRFGLDTSTSHHNMGSPNMAQLFEGTPNYADNLNSYTGDVTQRTRRRREINEDLFVNFDKDFNPGIHVNGLVGFNGNERRYSYLYANVTNLTIPTFYNLSNSAEKPTVSQHSEKRRILGVYAQAEVSWRDMLYLTMTARNDWSSTLPEGNRSFFYPGITGSWIFSELMNQELRKYITYGKLRLAWGKTGNDADVYMTKPYFGQAGVTSSGWGNSNFPFTKTNTNAYTMGNVLGSNTLSPEMTTEFEVGLNMAFLQNRVSFDASFYNRTSDKQIFSLDLDPASGFTAANTNLGKVRNRGIELLVSGTPIKTNDFSWEISVNFTRNWNKVISLPEELGGEASIYGLSGGTGIYAVQGKELGMFKAYVPQRTEDGKIIVNSETGLPVQGSQEYVGSINHKYQMGITNTLKYKDVSLSFDFDIRHGGLMYSRTKATNYFVGNAIQTAYNDRNPWIIPNSVVQTGTDKDGNPIYSENTIALDETQIYNFWNNGGEMLDAGMLVDKSYVKLRQVVLTWDLPKRWLVNTFLSGVSLSLYGQNLLLWTPSSNTFIDPETTSFGNDLSGNFGEWSANPTTRKFGFNVQVKF